MAIINEIVLIYLEDAPVSFARVESILPDAKKDWYHVKLLMLQIPLQIVTWILKDEYINGNEFHMNGKLMKIIKIESPVEELPLSKSTNFYSENHQQDMGHGEKKKGKIVSFADLKKNRKSDDAG